MFDESDAKPSIDLSLQGGTYSPVALIERERKVLGQIAAGVPLAKVLRDLLLAVEAQSSDMKASVLLLSEDGQHMLHGAAPSLPAAYNEAIHGIAIGEGIGSCGTAAFRGTPVYVEDIAASSLWNGFSELAISHGLRACWSMPIKAADGVTLGTFAVYYGEPRAPIPSDVEAITVITQTAALAIERHRADQRLRHSQEALRDLNTALEIKVNERATERDRAWGLSQELLVIASPDGALDEVNGRWTEQLGWSESELIGSTLSHFTHPEDLRGAIAAFTGVFDAPLITPYEYRLRHKDGSYKWFSWTGSFQDGRIYAAGRHVTSEREQAEALRQSQKMEAVGQLTGGVAHDFNNLLTVIRSSTDLLLRPGLTEERRLRYIKAISETVDRAAKLTGQLLAFARRQALQPEVFSVCDNIRAISGVMGTLTGSRIETVIELSDTPCFVNADPSQFDTALVNMVANARDAMMGEGRLLIVARAVESMPAVRAHPAVSGSFVAVSITDSGSGIPATQLEQIFEPFYTTKGIGEGTGLGLSQVFGFAKQSGGEVAVASEVGKGATFTLYLPRVDAHAPAAPETTPTAGLEDGHGTSVLVVEDNLDVGTFAIQALSELGYAPVLATSAQEALAQLQANPDQFDVVFSDVVMPGMTGIELAHALRAQYPDLPVVLTSGYSHVLAQKGSDGFELLHKPYSIDQLSRVLLKVITAP